MDHNLLKDAVASSYSLKQTLENLGYKNGGSTRNKVKLLITEHNIDTSHFGTRRTTNSSVFDDEDRLREIVKECVNYAEVIRRFNMSSSNGSYAILKNKIVKFNISTDHFTFKTTYRNSGQSLDEILVENSQYFDRARLKIRLVRAGLKKYQCNNCGNLGTWMNQPLVLQLDHINGINNDNRLENLQFLCPNCHTQTMTYAGRNNITDKTNTPVV